MAAETFAVLPLAEEDKLEQLRKYGVPLSAKVRKNGIEVVIPNARRGHPPPSRIIAPGCAILAPNCAKVFIPKLP